jgi:hypothetical protein
LRSPALQLTIELDCLNFLIKTSNCKEQSNKQEDVSRRKELKEQETASGNLSIDSVNSGYGPDYQIYLPLG